MVANVQLDEAVPVEWLRVACAHRAHDAQVTVRATVLDDVKNTTIYYPTDTKSKAGGFILLVELWIAKKFRVALLMRLKSKLVCRY